MATENFRQPVEIDIVEKGRGMRKFSDMDKDFREVRISRIWWRDLGTRKGMLCQKGFYKRDLEMTRE